MLTAVDISGNKHYIENVNSNDQLFCPICQQKLMQKRKGEKRRPHFAHFGLKDAHYVPCTDRWGYDKTEWHYDWQLQFPLENYEVVIEAEGKKHIADVLINGFVIEFQHSSISFEEFQERNAFYQAAGYQVIWVFDLQKEFSERRIHKEIWQQEEYRWLYVKNPFKEMTLADVKVVIFLQFTKPADVDTPILERVIKATEGFQKFSTDTSSVISISEFVGLVTNGDIKELFKKLATTILEQEEQCVSHDGNNREKTDLSHSGSTDTSSFDKPDYSEDHTFPQKIIRPPAPNAKSIRELWNSDYRFMIVHNTTNGDDMVIHGDNGRIETNDWGKIVGCYSNRDRTGRYYYSKTYVVKDAEQPFWILKTSKDNEEAILKRSTVPISGAYTLTDLMKNVNESQFVVRCLLNRKCFLIDIVNSYYVKEKRFNAIEIDIETGEIMPGTQNGFVYPRRDLQVWKLLDV